MALTQGEWVGLWTLVAFICAWIYLPLWPFVLGVTVLAFFYARKAYQRRKAKEEDKRLQQDFASFLDILSGTLQAGANLITGLRETERELAVKEREDAVFTPALQRALVRYEEGDSLAMALQSLAGQLESPLVQSFVDSLLLGIERGADLAQLITSYGEILSDLRELEEEREAKLFAARREQNLLFAMPFILLVMMRLGGFLPKELNLTDILIRLVCLVILGLAWKWCRNILDKSYMSEREEESRTETQAGGQYGGREEGYAGGEG